MNRRRLLSALVTATVALVAPDIASAGRLRRFRVRLKTKGKSIISTTVEARDPFEDIRKAQKRYPDRTILNVTPEGRPASSRSSERARSSRHDEVDQGASLSLDPPSSRSCG